MAQFLNMYKVDLTEGAAPVVSLKQIHLGDHKANRVGAIVTMDGVPYPLGGNCAGTAILADGSTVPLTGTVAGNQAYVELDNACYQVEGQINVFVAWVSGSLQTTLLAAVGTVRITETSTVIQPSTPVPDLAELMAQITAMQEATAAANAAATKSVRYDTAQTLTGAQMAQARVNIKAATYNDLAPAFSSSAFYSAGDYVIYDGNLMQFTAAHSGAWTGTDAVSVTVSSGLSNGPVLYSKAQSLTGAQKAQARENIGAAQVSPTDFNGSSTGMFIEY